MASLIAFITAFVAAVSVTFVPGVKNSFKLAGSGDAESSKLSVESSKIDLRDIASHTVSVPIDEVCKALPNGICFSKAQ